MKHKWTKIGEHHKQCVICGMEQKSMFVNGGWKRLIRHEGESNWTHSHRVGDCEPSDGAIDAMMEDFGK